jgi:hypothetical protein
MPKCKLKMHGNQLCHAFGFGPAVADRGLARCKSAEIHVDFRVGDYQADAIWLRYYNLEV